MRLTDCLGAEVTDGSGARVGRLDDVAVTLEDEHPAVRSLIVRRARGHFDVVPWARVRTFEPTGVVVGTSDGNGVVAGDELRLARDVLDAQIVDVAGRRVRRVSDVDLERSGDELRAMAVDVGWPGLLRRLGFRRAHAPQRDLVDWGDLHVASPRGHGLQLRTTGAALHRLSPAELSELVARLPPQPAAEALHAVGPERAAAAMSIVRPPLGAQLVGALPPETGSRTLEAMPPDDAAAVLRDLDAGTRTSLLAAVTPERRGAVERLLAHRAETAGGLMTTDMRIARDGEPLEAIVARLRRDPPPLEGLFTVLVTDDEGRLVGVLPPSALLCGGVVADAHAVTADTPLERVAELFARHDLVAVPVVDGDRRPLGVVAVDDVLEEILGAQLPQHRRRYWRPFQARRAKG